MTTSAPPIKVGFVGYGNSAKHFHLPYILPNPDIAVHAFLQRAEAPVPAAGGAEQPPTGVHCTIDHPSAKHYRTADEFFADPEIELVIVCTKPPTHAEFAGRALLAGKHVVVEKPFTVTSDEADKLIAFAKTQDKILTVYQNRRYDSDFRMLWHTIKDLDALGTVTECEIHYDWDDPPGWPLYNPPKPGDGMLYDVGVHSIDQALLLFGCPESVTAFIRILGAGRKAEDTFTIILQYGGERENLLCTIKTTVVSAIRPDMQLKYYVRGTRGTFTKTGQDPQIEHYIAGMKADNPAYGVESDSTHGYLYSREAPDPDKPLKPFEKPPVKFDGKVESRRGSYMDYYRDVITAIRGERSQAVDPVDSRNGIRVLELAKLSAEKGTTVPWS